MKNTVIDSGVKDTYKEHRFHDTYQEDCSECYKNIMLFDGKIDDDITDEEWEQCKQDKLREEADDRVRQDYEEVI